MSQAQSTAQPDAPLSRPQPLYHPHIRAIRESDDPAQVTALLHRAYGAQVARGMKPLAGRQDVEVTRRRCASGVCLLAFEGLPDFAPPADPERLAGTILLQEKEPNEMPGLFGEADVAHFSQFAVDPEFQGHGVGEALLRSAEGFAIGRGFKRLALSMAEPDVDLRRYYERRGYWLHGTWQWPYTNYRSLLLCK
ncbi:MAG: GNAT family N-acetyltransferase, partial [Phycisphaerales bacterium]